MRTPMLEPQSGARINAFIGIGSNLDAPIEQVNRALGELDAVPASRLVGQSSLYTSPPMGPPEQPNYINAVAQLRTELEPQALLDELLAIEGAHGRVRGTEHWGPRTLDLDLLLYGDRRIDSERLTVPHPRLHEREFVLYPLQELAGNLYIPGRGRLHALINRCPRGELRRLEIA